MDEKTSPAVTKLAVQTPRLPEPTLTTSATAKKPVTKTRSDSENPPPRVTDGPRGKIPLGVLEALIGTPRVTVGKIRMQDRDLHLPHHLRGHRRRAKLNRERAALPGTLKEVPGNRTHTPKAVRVRNKSPRVTVGR